MRLTKHTDFAFRTLIYLATMNEELTTIRIINDKFGLSKSHLMKIVQKLGQKGWVETIRGKNGGIRLAVPADKINARDVVILMEQTLTPVNCKEPMCTILPTCKLKGVLWESQRLFLQHLHQYTLADLVDQPTSSLLHSDT